MTSTALGDLEHQVLLATLRLKDQAYSVSVVLEIEARTGRDETVRARRHFTLSPVGLEKLREMRLALRSLWQGLASELDGA